MQAKARKVILRRCEAYEAAALERIIGQGIEELGEKPSGKVLIKPNVVCSTRVVQKAHTHPAVVEALVRVVRAANPAADVTVGESGGMAIPTRLFLRHAGYAAMARRARVRLCDFNEERCVRARLSRAKWHETVRVAKSLWEASYKIWVPKLKFHNACGLTNALKLNIGILTHGERMLYHDERLHEKIVDLLEIGYPDLVVADAVEIGHGSEFAPSAYPLGAILLANDPLAADMVAARILNFQPAEVEHLAEASRRGYGSLDFDEIEVSGDTGIEELAEKVRRIDAPHSVQWSLDKVKTAVRFYPGMNPRTGRGCSTGCLNALAGALATSELYWPGLMARLQPMGVVVGFYRGDVLHPGEKVALVGSCSGVEGRLQAGKIIRLGGCPAKGMDQALFLFPRLGIRTPAWKLSSVLEMAYFSLIKACMRIVRALSSRIGPPGVPTLRPHPSGPGET
ncbi:MAG: DUF362 domain-containing protein [bacterium]